MKQSDSVKQDVKRFDDYNHPIPISPLISIPLFAHIHRFFYFFVFKNATIDPLKETKDTFEQQKQDQSTHFSLSHTNTFHENCHSRSFVSSKLARK